MLPPRGSAPTLRCRTTLLLSRVLSPTASIHPHLLSCPLMALPYRHRTSTHPHQMDECLQANTKLPQLPGLRQCSLTSLVHPALLLTLRSHMIEPDKQLPAILRAISRRGGVAHLTLSNGLIEFRRYHRRKNCQTRTVRLQEAGLPPVRHHKQPTHLNGKGIHLRLRKPSLISLRLRGFPHIAHRRNRLCLLSRRNLCLHNDHKPSHLVRYMVGVLARERRNPYNVHLRYTRLHPLGPQQRLLSCRWRRWPPLRPVLAHSPRTSTW